LKYFHRTSIPPDQILAAATRFFGGTMGQIAEQPRRRQFEGAIGRIGVSVQAEGGHYTLVTVETDQVGESEADKLAKRFLTLVHTLAEPSHRPIGAY
jgi:hypothetical protein